MSILLSKAALGPLALQNHMVMAPLTVTGTSVLAQSDSLACAFPAIGTAVTKAR